MSGFEVLAWLIILSAAFSYLNHMFLRVPRAIGLLLGGLFGALSLATVGHFFPGSSLAVETRAVIQRFNFAGFVLNGVLGFITFAGALEVDVEELHNRRLARHSAADRGEVAGPPRLGNVLTLLEFIILISIHSIFTRAPRSCK